MVKAIIMVLFYVMAMAKDIIGEQNKVDQWLHTFNKANEKVTHIHFYVQASLQTLLPISYKIIGNGMVKAIIMVLFFAMAVVKDTIGAQNEVDQWLHTFNKANEKVTRIHFYVHALNTGPNKTDVVVAQGPESSKSPGSFGTVVIYDYYVTEGPELTSNKIGRAQGIASFNDPDEIAFLLVFNFVFTSGEFNGSSIAMLGRNPVFHPLRELPIVGGTGMFRLARGFAKTTTYQFNTTANNGVYEYSVLVLHY